MWYISQTWIKILLSIYFNSLICLQVYFIPNTFLSRGIWYVFVMYHLVMKTCIFHRQQLTGLNAKSEPKVSNTRGGYGILSRCSLMISKLLLVLVSINLHGWCFLWYIYTWQTWMLNRAWGFDCRRLRFFELVKVFGEGAFDGHI